jgi:hypothetical protein
MPADNKTADTAGVKVAADVAEVATDAQSAAAGAAAARTKHATLRYATLRIAIFILSLAALWGAVAATGRTVTGNGVLYLMMGSLLISGVASFFLLSRQRDAMSEQVSRRADRMTDKFQANAAMEDED